MNDELAEKLNGLHKEAEAHLTESKRAAVQIGEELFNRKNASPQREFTKWVQGSLCFDVLTAARYLETFRKAETKKWSGFNLL